MIKTIKCKEQFSPERFKQLLLEEDTDTLIKLFDKDPSSVRRLITRYSYSPNEDIQKAAIDGFYNLSKQRAITQTNFFREIIRRHIWGMNDEGGNIDWSAPEIIGAVIAGQPKLFYEFISIMFYTAYEEPFFHTSLLKALLMIERSEPGAAKAFIKKTNSVIHNNDS